MARGRALVGHLMALLMLMKAQPLAYNKDNQGRQGTGIRHAQPTPCLPACEAFADMLPALQVKRDTARQAARRGFSTATDLADYLVHAKGVTFRDAHEIVGKAVRLAIDTKRDPPQKASMSLRSSTPPLARTFTGC